MTKNSFILILLLNFILPVTSFSAESAANIEARVQRVENGLLASIAIKWRTYSAMTLAERMRFYKVPGLSVAVINNGAIEWARGYGVLDAESKVPVNENSLFQAASISKPVFAMAALSMVEKGELVLDEDVNLKLKSWQLPESESTKEKKVTLRTLLTHIGGTTPSGFRGYTTGAPVPTVVQLLDGIAPANSAAVRVDKVPGSAFRYSGGGMIVAQLLVSDVSNQPFAPFMKATVLNPLGMTHSSYEQPLPASMEANAATAHNSDGIPVKGKWNHHPEQAAAGLVRISGVYATKCLQLKKIYLALILFSTKVTTNSK